LIFFHHPSSSRSCSSIPRAGTANRATAGLPFLHRISRRATPCSADLHRREVPAWRGETRRVCGRPSPGSRPSSVAVTEAADAATLGEQLAGLCSRRLSTVPCGLGQLTPATSVAIVNRWSWPDILYFGDPLVTPAGLSVGELVCLQYPGRSREPAGARGLPPIWPGFPSGEDYR